MALCELEKPLCRKCLEPGHNFAKCQGDTHLTPCESGVHRYISCKTEECKARTNWESTSHFSVINSNLTSNGSRDSIVNGVPIGKTLLPLQMISTVGKQKTLLRIMFDNCSQTTFILESAARRLKLRGKEIFYALIITNGTKVPSKGKLYTLTLQDRQGELHEVQAISLEKISSEFPGVTFQGLENKFSHNPMCADFTDRDLNRTKGAVELLIGSDLAALHPRPVGGVRQIKLLKSRFGTGWTVMGHDRRFVRFKTNREDSIRVNMNTLERLIS